MKIIGISGRKQSGKNTVANCLSGIVLKNIGHIMDYTINQDGQLVIQTTNAQGDVGWGIFDVLRKDKDFLDYAEYNIWPYVKTYHFADYLKQMCVDLFDLAPHQVYGTDVDKNTLTPYDMTAREFLQYFGTDVMRKIKDTVWVDYTLKTINSEGSSISIIPDVRFPNEVEAIKNNGGYVIRLTRDVHNSHHGCETALDRDKFDWEMFDKIIYNESCDINGLNSIVQELASTLL